VEARVVTGGVRDAVVGKAYATPVGTFLALHFVPAKARASRDEAVAEARAAARLRGWAVLDVAQATLQSDGESWLVDLQVEQHGS
jgi:hypothetical protein